jgi:hypothetical protein
MYGWGEVLDESMIKYGKEVELPMDASQSG